MSLSGLILGAALLLQGVDATGTAVARPIGKAHLEPVSGSYYQIFEFYGRPPHTWEHAQQMVRGYLHEGREGRLAHIKTQAAHFFVLINFPKVREFPMWIGLSATCEERAEIRWLDGSHIRDQSFRAWNVGAQQKISRTCRDNKLSNMVLPVYYDPHELGTRWEAGTLRQNLRYMVVEFPVPEEPEETTEEGAEDEAGETVVDAEPSGD